MPIDPKPRLAAVHYERGFDVNGTLREAISRLRAHGVSLGGVFQEADTDHAGAYLRIVDLRSGKSARLTEDRGKEAGGCKLDPGALAEIAPCVSEAIRFGVELIVINKFGRAESEGHGLLSSIAEAMCQGVPVLTTVREPYLKAWRTFHGGLATELPPSLEQVVNWCQSATRGLAASCALGPEG